MVNENLNYSANIKEFIKRVGIKIWTKNLNYFPKLSVSWNLYFDKKSKFRRTESEIFFKNQKRKIPSSKPIHQNSHDPKESSVFDT